MAKKKKKQMRETLYCPYCKRPGVLRPAAYVYGDNNLDPEKYLYVCSGYYHKSRLVWEKPDLKKGDLITVYVNNLGKSTVYNCNEAV